MRILIVEDERKTAEFLRRGLTENGYSVEVVANGDEGSRMARAGGSDLIVLDVMLPGRDGWTILGDLRAADLTTPVLFLTARDTVADRVKGLEMGADDYLVKPFAFAEFLARVRTLLRRVAPKTSEILQIADLEIDTVRHRATRAGQRLDLTPTEFLLLLLLAQRAGEVLARSFLAERVWEMPPESDPNVVHVHVRRLRSKVDDPFPVKLIQTVRGVGYVLQPTGAS